MRGENSEIRRRGSPEKAENKQAKKNKCQGRHMQITNEFSEVKFPELH